MAEENIYINPLILPMLNGTERFNIAYGGRNSGKSWGISDILLIKSLTEKDAIILCAKGSMNSIADSVKSLLEMQIVRHGWEEYFYITDKEIICKRTKSKFIFYGLRNADRLKSIESVKYMWIEEANIEVTHHALDVVIPTLRIKGNRIFITFNPFKATDPVYERFVLNEEPSSNVVKINYLDNPFCSEETLGYIRNMRRTNIDKYNHLFLGELQQDFTESIFKSEYFNYMDIETKSLEKIVVAVDPSGSDSPTADEAGIVVSGSIGDTYYVLEDDSGRFTPLDQAKRAIRLYQKYSADYIVVEKNGVGNGFKTIIQQIDRNIPVKEVTATRGKKLRAMPVASLYEAGRVFHKEVLSLLEYELVSFDENNTKISPGRLDAVVYSITSLMKGAGTGKMSTTSFKLY